MIASVLIWKSIWLDCVTDQRYTKAIKTFIWLIYSCLLPLTSSTFCINSYTHMNIVDILLTAVTPKWKIFENEINKSMCFHSFKVRNKRENSFRRGCFVIQTLSLSHSFIISTDTYTCGGNERDREAHTHIYIQLFGEITRRRRRRWEGKHETKEFLRINPRPINVSDSEKKPHTKFIRPAIMSYISVYVRVRIQYAVFFGIFYTH